MRAMRLVLLLVGSSVCLSGQRVGALVIMRPPAGLTAEWRVANADAVVRGVVNSHERRVVVKDTFEFVTLAVAESIKGPVKAGETIRVVVRNVNAYPWFDAGRDGKEYVFFLLDSESLAGATPSLTAAAWRSAPWAVPDRQSFNDPIPLFETLKEPLVAYSEGMACLRTREEILAGLRREAARGQVVREDVNLQLGGKEAELRPPEGTYLTDLLVPLDERALAAAKRWATSPDPMDRLNATVVLNQFESEESIAILRGMLADPFEAPFATWPYQGGFDFDRGGDTGKWRTLDFPIRARAWDVLVHWKAEPAEAVISPPAYSFHAFPRAWWRGGWMVLAGLMSIVLVRPMRRADRRPRLLAGAAGVSALLLVMAAAFWIRSPWAIDELSFPVDQERRVEVASINGHLRVLTIQPWTPTSPAMWITVPRTRENLTAWRDDTSVPSADRKGIYGFEYERGRVSVDWRQVSGFWLVRVPWWAITVGLVVLPLRQARRWQVFRARQSQGCCLNCGYDLRASAGVCPECGEVARASSK